MEVARVVLGAIPVVITALQYCKDMKKAKRRFSDRKSIVRRLIETLQLQQGELELNLEWLGKAIQRTRSRHPIFDYSLHSLTYNARLLNIWDRELRGRSFWRFNKLSGRLRTSLGTSGISDR